MQAPGVARMLVRELTLSGEHWDALKAMDSLAA